ncbi:30S ribosomal protein S21 [Candidatus Roizmanbacteria bacterium]|nr:30S ribosomal protein S21 [Candidatus Roizmanbacteria bacterium]
MNKKRGETKDSLFRKFTRSFLDEEIVDDVRKKLFYKKPSTLRKEKEKERKQMRGKKTRYSFMFKRRPRK